MKLAYSADGSDVHIGADANGLDVDIVRMPWAVISSGNSFSSNLGASLGFSGPWEEVKDFGTINVSVYASHASAVDGLQIQWSSDGVNVDLLDSFSILADKGSTFTFQPAARYFKVFYLNGATTTTSLRIQSIFHYFSTKSSSQRPADGQSNQIDTEQVSALGMVYNGTTWDRARGDATYGSDVDITRYPSNMVTGSISANGQIVSIDVGTCPSVACFVYGTFGITNISMELSFDNVNWFGAFGHSIGNGSLYSTAAIFNVTPVGINFPLYGARYFRARCTGYTSGPVNIALVSSTAVTSLITNMPSTQVSTNIVGNVGFTAAQTATLTTVPDQATSVQIVASNGARKDMIIHNDSPATLYINYGGTASLTSYTYKIPPDATWEMNFPYNGAITGIWAFDASGSARITQMT